MSRILVVDDDIQLLRALRINFTARGYDIRTAGDGKTALRTATDHPPDVVVLDLGLPDLDGTDVITELRTFTTVPIIVLSARTDSPDKVHALDRGADDYVTKPFRIEELMARVRAALRRATNNPATDDAPLEAGELTIDLTQDRPTTRPGHTPDPDRMEHPRPARAPPRPPGQPTPTPGPHLGPHRAQGHQLPAGLPGPTPPQARTRPHPPRTPHHRSRHGLPLPPLTSQISNLHM
jgi:CheY-like chemotaxis protein